MRLSPALRALGVRLGARPVPLSVSFEITHRCNLACAYCDRHAPGPNEMAAEQVLTVLDALCDAGMRTICLDGGEPLTHPHVDRFVERLVERGVRVNMNSNGLLVPRKLGVVRRLSKMKVSLDGPQPVHDAVRGTGSYVRALRGIVAARSEGIHVELTCVVGAHNVGSVDALVELAQGLGLRVVFQPEREGLFRAGHPGAIARAVREAFVRIERHKHTGKVVGNRWSSLRHFRSFPFDTPLPCAAGRINATLDPAGMLYACGQLPRLRGGISVLEHGVQGAFDRLPRVSCRQCWCARVVEENDAWGGRFERFLPDPVLQQDEACRKGLPAKEAG